MSVRELYSEPAATDAADGELVAQAQEGSRDALEELVRRHQAWVYNVARRMVGNPDDAADVTQEVLI
jgi:DNA-directed RNA polymerase specialized sigma24 family protein